MKNTDWPRLTETLTGPIAPEVCRACGMTHVNIVPQLWQEHDENDKPEARYLWLCGGCSDRIIEPHPRLYARLHANAPAPGAMLICSGCPFNGPRCMCPQTKANGGEGIAITASKPMAAFVDGRNKKGQRVGWRELFYEAPPAACSGKPA